MAEQRQSCQQEERAIQPHSRAIAIAFQTPGPQVRPQGIARARLFLASLTAAAFLLTGCSISRNWQAALLAADIAAGTGPSRLKRTTPAPIRSELEFAVDDRRYRGAVYRPAGRVQAGLVLAPGAAEQGKEDPRLVAFAISLARVGFAVLVPDLPGLRELKVNSDDIGEISDVYTYLLSRKDMVRTGRAGLGAFSYAAGPAMLAAAKPEMAENVDFMLAIGGYYSIRAVLIFITTGAYRLDGQWRHMQPNPYGKWVFVKSNMQFLNNSGDRRLFQKMIDRKRADLTAPIDDLARKLTAEGSILYQFVTNTRRSCFDRLFAALPEAIRHEVQRLDLADGDLSSFNAHLILVHGYDDTIIPYSESVALNRALPPDQAELYLVDGLMHVDAQPGLVGKWRMWRALASLLAERDRDNRR